MASNIILRAGTVTSVQATGGSSVSNGTAIAAATIIDNATNKDDFVTFELNVAFATSPSIPASIELYLVPALDGTNYAEADTTAGSSNVSGYAGLFKVIYTSTASQRLVSSIRIPLGPFKYTVYILNRTGVGITSSGWTLTAYGAGYQAT